MNLVRPERTNWRDEDISKRHRRWGWECPALDIDFLMLEFDRGRASVIVEYKHERAAPQFASHPSYQALIDLGTNHTPPLPVFAVRYASDWSWWRVVPLNPAAHTLSTGMTYLTSVLGGTRHCVSSSVVLPKKRKTRQ